MRGAFAVIIVLAFIGYKVWNGTRYHQQMQDDFQITGDTGFYYEFELEKVAQLKIDYETVTKDANLSIWVLRKESFDRAQSAQDFASASMARASAIASKENTRQGSLETQKMAPGKWVIVYETGDKVTSESTKVDAKTTVYAK